MGERKLRRITEIGRRLYLLDYPVHGLGLKFVSGPEETKDIKLGSWLENWEVRDGKRVFGFGTNKGVIFSTLEDATAVQEQLKSAVDVITEIAL